MANPFGFTRTTSVTTPNSARVDVAPNLQASEAFKSLANLVDTGLKFQQDKASREAQQLTLETQWLGQQQADYQTIINEKLDEIQTTTLNDWNALTQSRTQKVMDAGIDLNANARILEEFSDNLTVSYESLPPEIQKTLSTTYNRFLEQGNADYNTVYQTNRKNQYVENIDTLAVTTLQMTPEERAAVLNREVAKAERFGFSRSEVSQRMFKNGLNYLLVNSVDEESLNNFDYSGLNLAEQYIEDAIARDPKLANKPAHLQALETLKTTKNEMDSALTSALGASITNGDAETAEYLTTVALANGAIGEQESYNLGVRLANKLLGDTTKPEAQVQRLIQANGYQPIWRQPPELQSAYREQVKTRITQEFNSPTPNLEVLRKLYENDPAVYQDSVKTAVTSTQKNILSTMASDGGTPEAKAERDMQLQQQVAEYQKFQQMNFGPMTDEQRLTDSVIQLASRGLVPDTKFALEVFNSEARNALISTADPNVRKLRDDLPPLAGEKAHREYSAFVAMGVDKDTALDEAMRLNGLQSVSGTISSMTPSSITALAGKGIAEEKIKFIEQVLTDPDNDSIPEEFRNDVMMILDQSGAVIEVADNALVFRSDDSKAGRRIPMNDINWTALNESVNELFRDEVEVGLAGAVASDVGDVVAVGVNTTFSFWATAGDLFTSPTGPIGRSGEAVTQAKEFMADVQAELAYVDKLNLELYKGKITSSEYNAKLRDFNKTQAERRMLEEGKRRGEAQEETQRRIDAFFEATGDYWINRGIGAMFNSIFN